MATITERITRRLTVLVYFAIVLSPVFLLGYDGPWFGPGDISIRGKAPFPQKFAPGAFSLFDQWFGDRVGLRYPLIYLGTGFHVGMLRRPLDRHIVFGRDGWMYWTDDGETEPATMADSRGKLRFTPGEIERIDASLRALHGRLANCGIPGAVFIAPNKQSIYGEHLVNGSAPPTRLDALMEGLSNPARSVIIDARPAMRLAKAAHAPVRLYNKTESHWNDLGAYYGYAAIMARLSQMMPIPHPELVALDNYQVEVKPYPGGDMATRVLFSPWRFPDEDVRLAPKGRPPDPVVQVEHGHFVTHNPKGTGQLVLFGDSFATQLVPFLAQHFEDVHRFVGETLNGAIIARHHPDAVILETVEREAPRLLMPQVDLARACEK